MSKQYQSFKVMITRDQYKWIHGHRLNDNAKQIEAETYDRLWSSTPSESFINFGGLHGNQFKTKEEAHLFEEAFDNLLLKFGIGASHLGPLLYCILFLGEDFEQQSLENNTTNWLIEYARFIMDVYANSKAHFLKTAKDQRYQMIFDETTQEYLFAKKSLYESMPLEELVEHFPDEKHKDDIIRYMRIPLLNDELYVPPGMFLTLISPMPIKSFSGTTVPQIPIPAYLQDTVMRFTISEMVDAHKRADTAFYKCLIESNLNSSELTKVYNQYKKKRVSLPQSLLRVAVLISDYLSEHKLITVKRTAAAFIFEYFSLLKAFTVKSTEPIPHEYGHLANFYTRNGITKETIRMMLKDVGEI